MKAHRDSSRYGSEIVQQRSSGKPGGGTLVEQWARDVHQNGSAAPTDWSAAPLQLDAAPAASGGALSAASDESIHATAADGVASASSPLPFADQIAASFGVEHTDTVHGIRAQVGGAASDASDAMGATAYATGAKVGFGGTPDVHTAAHEAAHVVQQRQGVHLKGGVGEAGDPYERHADAVADKVVRGESAASLLGPAGGVASVAVQRDDKGAKKDAKAKPDANSKEGQALKHLHNADTMLASLVKASAALSGKVEAKTATDKLVAQANALLGAAVPAEKELDDAQSQLRDFYSDELTTRRGELPEVVSEIRQYPGMLDAVTSVTNKLGHFFADISTVRDLNESVAKVVEPAENKMFSSIKHVRGVLNLPTDYDTIRGVAYATTTVTGDVFNLHHQAPSQRISNFAIQMAQSWDRSTGRFADAVGKFIETIDAEQFKKADSSFVDTIWDHAQELLLKGAEIVSGTNLGAKIGIAALTKLRNYEAEVEAQRQADDKKAYINALYGKIQAMQTVGEDGKSPPTQIQANIDEMVDHFYALGKTNADQSDTYKDGDQVAMGAQGDYLRTLDASAAAATSAVPTTADFMAHFLADWVKANHAERKSSAFRSPLADSTHMDGYIEYDLDLAIDNFGTFMLDFGEEAKLHCPKASNVAEAMMNTIKPLTLRNSNCAFHVTINADGPARGKLPEVWGHDRSNTIRFFPGGMVDGPQWMHEYWQFIQSKPLRVGPSDPSDAVIKLVGE